MLLTACTVSNPKHPVELAPAEVVPVSTTGSAPKNAQSVTIVKPLDKREKQEVATAYTAPLAQLLIPIVVKHSYIVEQDAGVWFGNGLTAGLENAGYHVEHADTAKDAKTPVVIRGEVTEIAVPQKGSFSITFSPTCDIKVAANVTIAKAGQDFPLHSYEGEGEEKGLCTDASTASHALAKGLENLLGKAVPEVATALVPLTQP